MRVELYLVLDLHHHRLYLLQLVSDVREVFFFLQLQPQEVGLGLETVLLFGLHGLSLLEQVRQLLFGRYSRPSFLS